MKRCMRIKMSLRSSMVFALIGSACQPLPQGVVDTSPRTQSAKEEPSVNRQSEISDTPDVEPSPQTVATSTPTSIAEDSNSSEATSDPVESFQDLEGVRVSYQFSEATRLMIRKELSQIPLLDLPAVVVPKNTPHGLLIWYIAPLQGILNQFKKNPLLLVDFDVMLPSENLKDVTDADALGFSYFEMLEQQKPMYRNKPKFYNEHILTQGHEYPGDPFVPYKYQLNHLIRVGGFFMRSNKDTPYANVGHLFTILLHEMQHFQGTAFDHAQYQLGQMTMDGDQISNGPYSIMVPVLERLIEGCGKQEKLKKTGTPQDRALKCTPKDKAVLLAIHSYFINVSSFMIELPKGPPTVVEGTTIQPM